MARRVSKHVPALACVALSVSACGGDIGFPLGPSNGRPGTDSSTGGAGGGGIGGQSGQLQFECKPDARSSTPLRRLSRIEYQNALRDVIAATSSETTANAVMQSVSGAVASIPNDLVNKHAAFGRMDQTVSQQHVEAYFNVGKAVASAMTTGERLEEVLGSCAGASGDAAAACIDGFVARFGKHALRHPLSDSEKAFYREVYGDTTRIDAAAVADVISVMFTAPGFVYQVELGSDPVSGVTGLYQLTDYEIAARLSFQFWQTTPDAELLAAAERGELRDDAGYEAAVDYVLSSPRAERAMKSFAREWFGLNELRAMDSLVGDPVFDSFAGDFVPSPDLKDDMVEEFTDALAWHTFKNEDSLRAWIESPYSFARSEELASIYHTATWDGANEPPRFPEGERAGLLTRAALLATGSANTRPIMKGVTIRERLLCDTLASPPSNANTNPPELSPTLTTREVVESLTEQPGSSCAGCHEKQINPLGFATENYDALARVRETQALFSAEGERITERPVDTSTVPNVWIGDSTPSSGARDLTQLVAESGKVEACFARQFVRFAQGRTEDEAVDGCALETVRSALAKGDSVRSSLRAYAMLPAFRQRLANADS